MYSDLTNSQRPAVQRYNGSTWELVGQSGFTVGGASITTDPSGIPYVVSSGGEGGKAIVLRFNGSSWEGVGNSDFSLGFARSPRIAMDDSGVPYVSYIEQSQNNEVVVRRLLNDVWEQVGNSGSIGNSSNVAPIAINTLGEPYVVFRGSSGKAVVKRFNGNDWIDVGTTNSNSILELTSIIFKTPNQPIIAYSENSSRKAIVEGFTGTTWELVGGEALSAGFGNNPSIG